MLGGEETSSWRVRPLRHTLAATTIKNPKSMQIYNYIHDKSNRTVYKFPISPNITEQKDRRGNRTEWIADMAMCITRADNKLNQNQWLHATSDYPRQHLDPKYTKDRVIYYFLRRHIPPGETISETEYVAIHQEYEDLATAN